MSGPDVVEKGSLDPADSAFADVVADLLRRGHSVRFRAKGGSMMPTIREGEAITVAPVAPDAIRRGDVVLYRSGQGVTAHRVVSVEQPAGGAPRFVTRGDASGSCDEPVEEAAVLGSVVAVERGGRIVDPAAPPVRLLAWIWSAARRPVRWVRDRFRHP
jgi:signal peptidase I